MRGVLAILPALFLAGCATSSLTLPPVSPALFVHGGANHASAQQLNDGRKLFASRCIDCHTLPPVGKFTRDEWPILVRQMSVRADLTAGEEQSIIAYLRVASSMPH